MWTSKAINGMSSPIRSPQFLTRNDFFADDSCAEGVKSTLVVVSFGGSGVSFLSLLTNVSKVLFKLSLSGVSVTETGTVAVVLARVNLLFLVETVSLSNNENRKFFQF